MCFCEKKINPFEKKNLRIIFFKFGPAPELKTRSNAAYKYNTLHALSSLAIAVGRAEFTPYVAKLDISCARGPRHETRRRKAGCRAPLVGDAFSMHCAARPFGQGDKYAKGQTRSLYMRAMAAWAPSAASQRSPLLRAPLFWAQIYILAHLHGSARYVARRRLKTNTAPRRQLATRNYK